MAQATTEEELENLLDELDPGGTFNSHASALFQGGVRSTSDLANLAPEDFSKSVPPFRVRSISSAAQGIMLEGGTCQACTTQDELENLLNGLDPGGTFSSYASTLFKGGVRSLRDLAHLEPGDFDTKSVLPFHVRRMSSDAKAKLGGQGGQAPLTQRLASPLPNPSSFTVTTSTSSTAQANRYWWPTEVNIWVHTTPDDPHTRALQEAIIEYQTRPPFPNVLKEEVPRSLPQAITNEAEVRIALATLLNRRETPTLSGASWHHETRDKLVQGAFVNTLQSTLRVSEPLPALAAGTGKHRQDTVLSIPLPADPVERTPLPSASAVERTPLPSASAGLEQPGDKRRLVCIGEVKGIKKLCHRNDNDDQEHSAPLDLASLCNNAPGLSGTSIHHGVSTVNQLYTYMAANCVVFGFISSWRYTWLARLVPDDLEQWPWTGKLYLSPPIASTASYTVQQPPQVTVIGSLSWLQYQALHVERRYHALPVRRQALPPRPGSGPPHEATAQDPFGPWPDSFGSAHYSTSDEVDDSKDPDYDPGSSSQDSWRLRIAVGADGVVVMTRKEHPTKSDIHQATVSTTHQARALKTPRRVHLEEKVCDGCYGAVFRGVCDGAAAIIKLLGPSREGMEALYRERDMLRYLATANVRAVPQLLGIGHLYTGVHFLATALVVGQPLSRVRPLTQEVADAAQTALAQVHAVHPRLLHGDIRLQNVLLVTPPVQPSSTAAAGSNSGGSSSGGGSSGGGSSGGGSSSGGSASPTTPECKIIDFGASSFDGTPEAQDEEMRHLQYLLQEAIQRAQ